MRRLALIPWLTTSTLVSSAKTTDRQRDRLPVHARGNRPPAAGRHHDASSRRLQSLAEERWSSRSSAMLLVLIGRDLVHPRRPASEPVQQPRARRSRSPGQPCDARQSCARPHSITAALAGALHPPGAPRHRRDAAGDPRAQPRRERGARLARLDHAGARRRPIRVLRPCRSRSIVSGRFVDVEGSCTSSATR